MFEVPEEISLPHNGNIVHSILFQKRSFGSFLVSYCLNYFSIEFKFGKLFIHINSNQVLKLNAKEVVIICLYLLKNILYFYISTHDNLLRI